MNPGITLKRACAVIWLRMWSIIYTDFLRDAKAQIATQNKFMFITRLHLLHKYDILEIEFML